MFKRIEAKKDYIKNVVIRDYELNSMEGKIRKILFGKEIYLENDKWLWHLHLKLTDACQANCSFCIEKGMADSENPVKYLQNLDNVLYEMESQGILFSVSITGGEPLLFREFERLISVLKKHDIKFLTMNTNAILLEERLHLIDGVFDFVNISRHFIDDDMNKIVFNTHSKVPTLKDLTRIKEKMKSTKLRIQCVITEDMDYKGFLNFCENFKFADDLSFRKLMTTSNIHNVNYNDRTSGDSYKAIINEVSANHELVEQVLQDYYVYETWEVKGKNITFSYSDMELLMDSEKKEDERICREFILHPDSTFSGSWNKNEKIISKGE